MTRGCQPALVSHVRARLAKQLLAIESSDACVSLSVRNNQALRKVGLLFSTLDARCLKLTSLTSVGR